MLALNHNPLTPMSRIRIADPASREATTEFFGFLQPLEFLAETERWPRAQSSRFGFLETDEWIGF